MNLPDLTGLRVATARVSYAGPGRLDITRKGEDTIGLAFAPSWDILTPALAARKRAAKIIERARKVPELVKVALLEAAEISRRAWEDYVPRYAGELDASMTLERPDAWAWLARRRDLGLLTVGVCYCAGAEALPPLLRCHRYLWAARLVELGAVYEGEIAGPPRAQGDLFGGRA